MMLQSLSHADVVALVQSTPEQRLFDWKRDFAVPISDEARGELVKDILAIANGTALAQASGAIVYGVDPARPDPILGISTNWDDAKVQQLLQGAVSPPIEFLYYEVVEAGRRIAIIDVPRSKRPFHVISRDLGRLREGQILLRDGSSTRGVRQEDLVRLYLTPGFGYVDQVLRAAGAEAISTQARTNELAQLREREADVIRRMAAIVGLPPESLGL